MEVRGYSRSSTAGPLLQLLSAGKGVVDVDERPRAAGNDTRQPVGLTAAWPLNKRNKGMERIEDRASG